MDILTMVAVEQVGLSRIVQECKRMFNTILSERNDWFESKREQFFLIGKNITI